MANVITDLRRATSEINEIQGVLETKGKITPGTNVPFEQYSDIIESMGDTINVTGNFTVNDGIVVVSN